MNKQHKSRILTGFEVVLVSTLLSLVLILVLGLLVVAYRAHPAIPVGIVMIPIMLYVVGTVALRLGWDEIDDDDEEIFS